MVHPLQCHRWRNGHPSDSRGCHRLPLYALAALERIILPGNLSLSVTGMITAQRCVECIDRSEYFTSAIKLCKHLAWRADQRLLAIAGNFSSLLLATLLMASIVVTMNRLSGATLHLANPYNSKDRLFKRSLEAACLCRYGSGFGM